MKLIRENFIVFLCLILITINMSIAKDAAAKIGRAKLVGICLKGIAESMPPNFCWKKGADFGTIPSGCPKGYYRQLALCHKKCKSGFVSDGALLCKKKCKKGYKTHPLSCYKHLFSWYWRKVYFQKTLTNFSSKVPCPKGKYKSGALCYKNCNVIGMENCGIGACALSKGDCAAEIISMVIDVVSGLSDLFLFITSFGSSSAAKAAKDSAKEGLKKLGKRKVKRIAKNTAKNFKGKFFKVYARKGVRSSQRAIKIIAQKRLKRKIKKTMKKRAKKGIKDKIKEHAKEAVVDGITNTVVYAVCNEAYAQLKKEKDRGITFDKVTSAIDCLNIKNTNKECSKKQKDGGISCARQVMVAASVFDPTGLLTLGSAFMYEACDIPREIPEPSHNMKELKKYIANSHNSAVAKEKKIISVKKGCVRMFKHANYEGRSKTYCKNTKYVGKKDNDQWSSYVLGPDTSVVFFEHSKYKGKSYYTEKKKISNLRKIGYNDLISSIKISKNKYRVVFFKHYKYKGTAWMYTKGQKKKYVGKSQNDVYSAVKVGKKVKVKVYEHAKYKGKRKTFTKNKSKISKSWNDKISSLKVLSK